ncbi:hypothetical protein CL659_05425 [bacterium]|nr:hypothetical protein [bacterium]|tara:strand:- start:52708 stop:53733 length:1026 start_codon:yes stop_codon:yes gene_type:complete
MFLKSLIRKKEKDHKFITHLSSNPFIYGLKSVVDLQISHNLDFIKKSNKPYIAWHPTKKSFSNAIWEHCIKVGRPAYFAERGALPNTVVIDPGGFLSDSPSYFEHNWNNPLSDSQKNIIDEYVDTLKGKDESLEFQESNRMGSDSFSEKLALNGKHVVFVPLQLANDTVIQRWCDWVKDLKSFQDIVEQVAVYCPDVVFLVKNHPIARNPKSSTPLMSANRNIFVVDEFHYKDCLDVADKVLTINSGVGLQAMAWSVPTIVTGRAFYNFEKINQRATSIDDIVGMIKDDFAVSHERSRRFLYFLKFKMYSDCIQYKSKKNRYRNATTRCKYLNIRIPECNK